jgi:hypothetical protein
MKHTAGPWKVRIYSSGQQAIVTDNDDEMPLAVIKADEREGVDPMANAKLIAAAPALLECVERYAEHGHLHARDVLEKLGLR